MNIINEIRQIDGWLTPNEAQLLFSFAKNNPYDGYLVEIGSWKGRSTVCLGKGSQLGRNNRIIAIDPHSAPAPKLKKYLVEGESSTFDKFLENIDTAGIKSLVKPIKDFSFNAVGQVDGDIDVLFIDGSHVYEDVLKDLEMFFPKVREGGIIAFHDTTGGGPKQVVLEKVYSSKNFKHVRFVDSITYATKVSSRSLVDGIANAYYRTLFRIYTTYRTAKIPRPIKTVGKWFYNLLR